MITIQIQEAGGNAKDLDKQIAMIRERILFFPPKMTNFMIGVVSDALEIAYKKAKANVSGSVIGGYARMDGKMGWMSDAIEKNVGKKGSSIIGTVGIPEGNSMNYPGYIQEVGYEFPIRANYPKAMAFFSKSGKPQLRYLTSGVPASHWLTKAFESTKNRMEKKTEKEFDKRARKLFAGKKPK